MYDFLPKVEKFLFFIPLKYGAIIMGILVVINPHSLIKFLDGILNPLCHNIEPNEKAVYVLLFPLYVGMVELHMRLFCGIYLVGMLLKKHFVMPNWCMHFTTITVAMYTMNVIVYITASIADSRCRNFTALITPLTATLAYMYFLIILKSYADEER